MMMRTSPPCSSGCCYEVFTGWDAYKNKGSAYNGLYPKGYAGGAGSYYTGYWYAAMGLCGCLTVMCVCVCVFA